MKRDKKKTFKKSKNFVEWNNDDDHEPVVSSDCKESGYSTYKQSDFKKHRRTKTVDPIDIFFVVVTPSAIQRMRTETNRYAKQKCDMDKPADYPRRRP